MMKCTENLYSEYWHAKIIPVSKVHGATMGPIWGWQDPGGPHCGPIKLAIWDDMNALSTLLLIRRESTSPWWIPLKKASNVHNSCFLWCYSEQAELPEIRDAMTSVCNIKVFEH